MSAHQPMETPTSPTPPHGGASCGAFGAALSRRRARVQKPANSFAFERSEIGFGGPDARLSPWSLAWGDPSDVRTRKSCSRPSKASGSAPAKASDDSPASIGGRVLLYEIVRAGHTVTEHAFDVSAAPPITAVAHGALPEGRWCAWPKKKRRELGRVSVLHRADARDVT